MRASIMQIALPASAIHVSARTDKGFVTSGVRVVLRLESFAAFAAALFLYAHNGFSWPLFALLFLAPDLAIAAYLGGPRAGTAAYNLMHTYACALALTLAGFFASMPLAAACGLIWIAHIGFDRALGYGLKYATEFGDTHLTRLA